MQRASFWILCACLAATLAGSITPAAATSCTITSVQSVSGTTVSLGRYSGSTAPVAQVMTISLVLGVVSTGATCTGKLAASSITSPAQMSGAGTDRLRYDVQSLSGTSVLFTSTPAATISFSAFAANGATSVSASVTAQVVALAGQTLAAGGYSDAGVVVAVFDAAAPSTQAPGASSWFVNAAVNPTCTIGGLTAAADPLGVTVPVSATGVVSAAPIQRSYGAVVCNAPTDITMRSQNGGIVNQGAPGTGFTNVIPYVAQTTFGGATTTLSTATAGAGVSSSPGRISTTLGASGSMQVTITPQQPLLPLVAGRYADVLTITLAPL